MQLYCQLVVVVVVVVVVVNISEGFLLSVKWGLKSYIVDMKKSLDDDDKIQFKRVRIRKRVYLFFTVKAGTSITLPAPTVRRYKFIFF